MARPNAAIGGQAACPELDCVRHLLSPTALAWAERRAERLGIGADRALVSARLIDEQVYLKALATSLGVRFEPLDEVPRVGCPLDDARLLAKAATGLLPLTTGEDGAIVTVIAPGASTVRGLIAMLVSDPALAPRFRLTTRERFNRFVLRAGHDALIDAATNNLKTNQRPMSAAPGNGWRSAIACAVLAVPVLAAAIQAPDIAQLMLAATLAAVFIAWLALRMIGALIAHIPPSADRELPDSALPIYTVMTALYREAASVSGLLFALEKLDYPPEKLDVIVAVEADDCETRDALAALKTRFPITVIPVPACAPRTKPKALNVALPFARGKYTVIYDAEDRPDPDQLRRALQAFLAGPDNLACVQAQLCIDNTADSWLACYFTAEYAGQFDVFMPGLAKLGLPLPLGGSSNHFHTETLRKIGAWDPYNVTEDADLGMRLARFGYRTGMIVSTTYEEAPARFGAWLRQRTRWFKGWMQTWLVHIREPRKMLRQLGPAGFAAFHLMVGGNALAALVHPLFALALVMSLIPRGELSDGYDIAAIALSALYVSAASLGYLTSAFLGWLGLSRRNLGSASWVLLLTPLHWLILSLAAWRALYQLFTAPFAWEKTEHGLACSSHRATKLADGLVMLDRDLRKAKDDGTLPTINTPVRIRDTSSFPPRSQRVSA